MNIREFAALKVGDVVELRVNGYSRGTVSHVEPNGVRVVWGPRHDREQPFFYSVQSTAWMQWTRPEEEQSQDLPADAAEGR